MQEGGGSFPNTPGRTCYLAEGEVMNAAVTVGFHFAPRMLPVAEWMGLESAQRSSVFPNLGAFNSTLLLSRSALFQ